MKNKILFIATILLTSLISVVLYSYLTGNPTYPESVIQTKLNSKILNEEREIIIHLPKNYNKSKKYPVLYVLDGSSQDKHIANKFEILSTAGYVDETIIVGLPNIDGKGRQRDYTPPYMRMDIDEKNSPLGEGDKFLKFMETELFPYIKKEYSVSDIKSIAGNSRGGLLAMYSLLYNPKMFNGRFCFSPAFWRDDEVFVKKVSEFLVNNKDMKSFLFMSLGEKENEKMKKSFNKMTYELKSKSPQGLVWHSEYSKNSDHQNNAENSAAFAIRKWNDYINVKKR